jgi:cytochrome P450
MSTAKIASAAASGLERGGLDPALFGPDGRMVDDPYPALDALREHSPVRQDELGTWTLYRYHDAVRLLRHPRALRRDSQGRAPFLEGPPAYQEFMLHQDPPAHTRLRRLASRAFTPRAVSALRPRIESLVHGCLDRVREQGQMDLIADLALPLPCIVICEILGVPAADRERFLEWTGESTFRLLGRRAPPELAARSEQALLQLIGYLGNLIAERRGAPGDDLLSQLIAVSEDGDQLSPTELLSQVTGLLVAGFETTAGLIGNGMRLLVLHPEQLAALEANPEAIASAVEECLRFDPPVVVTLRVIHEPLEFQGVTIPADSVVRAFIAAANRDPRQFPEPARFDVLRTPNEHLSFGGGTHFCLGAHLARSEAQIALGVLLQRFTKFELESETPEWGRSLFRVLRRLPLRFKPRRGA